MQIIELLRACEVLAPLIEEVIEAFRTKKIPDFVSKLPEPSRAHVALNLRKKMQQ